MKPPCNGTARDRNFPLHTGFVSYRHSTFESWGIPDRQDCKRFPLHAGFRYAQVPFKTG
jgi:hypothetical protein